jgi:hypothetical protein
MRCRTIVTNHSVSPAEVIAQSDWAMSTQEEYDNAAQGFCDIISDIKYLRVGKKVIPGEFLRRFCTVDLVIS